MSSTVRAHISLSAETRNRALAALYIIILEQAQIGNLWKLVGFELTYKTPAADKNSSAAGAHQSLNPLNQSKKTNRPNILPMVKRFNLFRLVKVGQKGSRSWSIYATKKQPATHYELPTAGLVGMELQDSRKIKNGRSYKDTPTVQVRCKRICCESNGLHYSVAFSVFKKQIYRIYYIDKEQQLHHDM